MDNILAISARFEGRVATGLNADQADNSSLTNKTNDKDTHSRTITRMDADVGPTSI
jgi:hypothetical protein